MTAFMAAQPMPARMTHRPGWGSHRRSQRIAVAIALAALMALHGLALEAAPAAAATATTCPPNSDLTALGSGHRCVAELMRNVRSRLMSSCVLDPKAVAKTNPLYGRAECFGGSGVQAEAIAHARYIAQLNASGVFGDPPAVGGITANVQWEVTYPKAASTATPPGSRRVDVLDYDRSSTAGGDRAGRAETAAVRVV